MPKNSPSESRSSLSKRQAIREKRRQQQRRQRVTVAVIIAGVVILLVALLVVPEILKTNAPVGNITVITPTPHPDVNGRMLGLDSAPVTVEAFEDFQCPACRNFSEGIEHQIIDKYVSAGQVRYIYRFFPFIDNNVGHESDQAANASLCASEQGRFWDYHDMLFANWNGENQGSFSDKRLVAFAEAIGLDMTKFNACFTQNKYKSEVDSDLAEAQQLGVTGTPTIFVNGKLVVSATPNSVPSFEEISAAIDAALSGSGN